jgi:membrane protease subunit HflC
MVVYQVRDDQVALVRTFGRIAAPQPAELCKVPADLSGELDSGRIPAPIVEALAAKQVSLSDQADCTPLNTGVFEEVQLPETTAAWRISDGTHRLLLTLADKAGEIVIGDLNDMSSPDVKTEAGPYFKWPWPIQRIQVLDNRIHMVSMPSEEMPTKGGKNIIVTNTVGWRIAEPYLYSNSNGSLEDAEENLKRLVRGKQNAVIANYEFGDFVSINPDELQYDMIESEILAAIKEEARANYGIDIRFLGFRRLALPEQITEKVFNAMREERNAEAARYSAAGASEAARIIAEANSIADTIIDFAKRKAADIVAEGERRAAEYNKEFGKTPEYQELAMFLLQMEYLGEILKDRTTVIFDHEPPFHLLRDGAAKSGSPEIKVPDAASMAEPETVTPK